MYCSTPVLPVHHQFPQSTQTHVHWVGDANQPSHPLSFPSPLALNLSQHQGLFQWVSSSHQVASEHAGLISFRMDWLDLLAVQGTLKSLLQHHSSKASILRHSAFFMVQLSHPYMTTGKTIALTKWIFVSKVLSLLFLMEASESKIFRVGWQTEDPEKSWYYSLSWKTIGWQEFAVSGEVSLLFYLCLQLIG